MRVRQSAQPVSGVLVVGAGDLLRVDARREVGQCMPVRPWRHRSSESLGVRDYRVDHRWGKNSDGEQREGSVTMAEGAAVLRFPCEGAPEET